MIRLSRSLYLVTVLVASTLAVAACAPGASSTSTAPSTASQAVSTDVSKLGAVTLAESDFYGGGGEGKWWKAVIDAFEAKYPNVKIKRTTGSYDDVMKTLNLRMSGNDAPDLAPVNNGWQSMGTLVQGQQLLNLDPYAKAYGWQTRIPDTIKRQHQFSTDGRAMGTGSLFGVPAARVSIIGVYYNRAMLSELGLAVPSTPAQFEAACQKAKVGGKVCVELGTLEQWQTTPPLFTLQNSFGDKAKIADFTFGQGNVQLADTGMLQAAQTLQKWSKAGYFTPDFSGISPADAGAAFVKGAALFRFDYSGSLPFEGTQSDGFGFFLYPHLDGAPVATGATASNYSISARTKHPEAAAAFLDFISSNQAAQIAVDNGMIPLLGKKLDVSKAGKLFAEELAGQAQLDEKDTYVPYLDWSTPTFLDTIGTQAQLVLAARATPEELLAAAQKDSDAFKAKQAN